MSPPAPFSRGDYVRDANGDVHVISMVAWNPGGGVKPVVRTNCRVYCTVVSPASGDEPRQCQRCREAT